MARTARILTSDEYRQLSRKPVRFDEVGGIILTQERLDALSKVLPSFDYTGGFRSLEDAVEEARAGFPDAIEFLADGPNGLILVNTEGGDYPRYAAKVGIAPDWSGRSGGTQMPGERRPWELTGR